jgi:hypothetical protein
MPKEQSVTSINFEELSKKVFSLKGGSILIGGQPIKPEYKEALKDQANYFLTSNLYDLLKTTLTNESADIALVQSTNYEQVQFAKALYHCQFVLDNLIKCLTKI